MEYTHVGWRVLVRLQFCFERSLLIFSLLGSLYFLVLIACARLRPVLRQLKGPSCGGLARLIRWPTGTCFSR
jgi:hypothetical protein